MIFLQWRSQIDCVRRRRRKDGLPYCHLDARARDQGFTLELETRQFPPRFLAFRVACGHIREESILRDRILGREMSGRGVHGQDRLEVSRSRDVGGALQFERKVCFGDCGEGRFGDFIGGRVGAVGC